jgi:hypothetical protein
MRSAHIAMAAALVCAAVGGNAFLAASSAGAQRIEQRSEPRNGSYTISGRAVECRDVRIVLDRRLPSEGAAGPGVLILNPRMLGGLPEVVRLFVFHHECGHHHVGASELQADCWAVRRGVDAGWLDAKGLKAVCGSFDNAPETPTHPSGRRRCRSIDQCFATAVAARDRRKPVEATAAAAKQAEKLPQLVSGPKLISSGTVRFSPGE